MPTIKDIARLAGVSHGTVSNVLNGRGIVSVEKIKAVKKAAKELGYQLNAQAKSLRAGTSKSIAIVLPNISSEQYHYLYSGLNNYLQKEGYTLDLYLTHDREEGERAQLIELSARQYQAVVTVSCFTDATTYYQKLNIARDKVIFVYRQPADAEQFFDLDMTSAADQIAEAIQQQGYQRIGVFTDDGDYSNVRAFNQRLSALLETSPEIELHYIASSHAESHKAAFEFFSLPPLDAIVCLAAEKIRHIRNASYLGSTSDCPPIYSLSGSLLRIEPGLYCYQINYQELGQRIGRALISTEVSASVDNRLVDRGFSFDYNPAFSSEPNETLNMLVIPSPSADALEKLLPNFLRQTGIKVNLTRYPFDELSDIAESIELTPYYDLLRIDMATSPWLAKKTFQPLAEILPDLLTLLQNYPAHIVERYSTVDEIAYSVPFDPSIQMLFYRRDIFEDPTIKRMFYEQYRQEMTLPVDFPQFDRLSQFFAQLHRYKGQKITGSCLSTGGTEMIATEFMLRYYAQGGRLLHADGPPKLTPEIAMPVLHSYIDSLEYVMQLPSRWWGDSVACFERGELAMLIVYMNLFSDVAHSELSPLIGYTPVPGGIPLLGGGAVGISKYSQKKQAAAQFLRWLFSINITEQIVLLGGCSANLAQYQNTKITDTYPWITLAREAGRLGIREARTPNGCDYDLRQAEKVIGQGVNNALNQLMSVEEAIGSINAILAQTA